jgi:hypothetical protein
MEAETALLGHRTAISRLRCLHLPVNPFSRRVAPAHLCDWLCGAAGRGLAANVVVAIAHD